MRTRAKRALVLAASIAMVVPTPAFAFHHAFLPAPTCADENSGGNAGGANPTARQALLDAGHTLPIPPAGTPGAQHSANTPAEQNCANR